MSTREKLIKARLGMLVRLATRRVHKAVKFQAATNCT